MKLYQYPHNAYVGTNIPKNRLYQQGKGGVAIEQLFIDEIEKITWQFKLSAATLNYRKSVKVYCTISINKSLARLFLK